MNTNEKIGSDVKFHQIINNHLEYENSPSNSHQNTKRSELLHIILRNKARYFLFTVCLVISVYIILLMISLWNKPSQSHYPNIIFFLIDDMGYGSIGNDTGYNLDILTRNINALRNQGITLTNYYTQEMCTPSRASLLTGKYPISIGMQYGMITVDHPWGLPLDQVTLPSILSDLGYYTYGIGKWNLGHFSPKFLPTSRGFDQFIGYLGPKNHYWSKREPNHPEYLDFIESDRSCYHSYEGDDIHKYSTEFYTDKAIDIIDSHKNRHRPFFMYLAYQAVHDPYNDIYHYTKGMPDEYLPTEISHAIHHLASTKRRQEYLKSLFVLDYSIGRIFDQLKESKLIDNTYIIFSSDNGGQ